MKKLKEFYIVIKDNDCKKFCIIGPTNDDSCETKRVVKEQKINSRDLTCSVVESLSREALIMELEREGFKEDIGIL